MSLSLTGNQTRGPLRWWYAIAAPRDVAEDAPLKERERVRIGKLTSLALFIELIEMGIAGYSATEDPNKLLPLAYLGIVVSLFIAMIFNRSGRIRVAGVLVVLMIEVGMILTILGVPNQQLGSFNLPIFALFIQPLLIAASLFPIGLIFPLAIYHIACICLALTFMPKTPELIAHIHQTPYTAYGMPITLQVVATLVSFIWVRSAYEEMRRAETAQEVTRLTQQLADQMLTATSRQEELERNIEVIRSTLTEVSNGNYQQQVPLTQQDLLWPIALSLNTLLHRLHAYREQSKRFEQLEQFLTKLARELYEHRTGQKSAHIPDISSGTSLDLLTMELRKWLKPTPARAGEALHAPTVTPEQPRLHPTTSSTQQNKSTESSIKRHRLSGG